MDHVAEHHEGEQRLSCLESPRKAPGIAHYGRDLIILNLSKPRTVVEKMWRCNVRWAEHAKVYLERYLRTYGRRRTCRR